MNNNLFRLPENLPTQARNAYRAILIVIGASLSSMPLYIYAARQTGAWQLYALVASLTVFIVIGGFSAVLARRNRIQLAMGLILGSTDLIILFIATIISGLGLVLGLTLVLITIMIAGQTLSGKAATRALLAGVAFAVITLFVDLFASWNRLSIPLLQTVIPYIAVGAVVILGIYTIPQFRNYSLRTKMISAFLVVSLIPTGLLSFLSINTTRQNLTEGANTSLTSAAAATSAALDEFIAKSLTDLRTAAQLHILQEYLALSASERAGSETETALYIDLRSLARRDQTFITAVGLLDKNGVDVADTDLTEVGKDKSDRNYFTGPLASKLPYISPAEISDSTGALSFYVSALVHDDAGNIIGVLRVRYDAAVLQKIVRDAIENSGLQGASADLFDENHIVLAVTDHPDEFLKTVVPLSADKLAQLQAERRLPEGSAESLSFNELELEEALNNADRQPVFTFEEENEQVAFAPLETQPWVVTSAQNRDVFLAPVAAQTRTSLIIALVVALAVAAFGLFLSQTLAAPIVRLTGVAQQIAGGDIAAQAKVETGDEIGKLAGAFNQMTAQLRELIGSLEQRVADRTKALATSSEVSRSLSTILERQQLVTEVVERVQTSFNYYHAHIYLTDEASGDLVMAGGTGEAGATMLASGHKISKGKGLVGGAAENNHYVLVSDTSANPDWLPNPLLPETKAELAVPISIGDNVLGVLDVQHNITGGLQQEDADLLQSIANQVAVALQNIRQYENTQKIAADMGVVANVGITTSTITDATLLLQEVVDLAKKSFKLYHAHIYLLNETGDALELTSGAGEVGRQMVSEKRSIPLDSEQSLVARAARTREGVVVNDVTIAPDFLPNPLLPDTRSEMAVPMIVAGKVIGVLDVQSEIVDRFTDVDVSIQSTLASQVAVALQNARSFSQAQRQVERETALNLITQKIQSATTIEAALQVTARELGHALGMKQTLVSLDPAELHSERKEKQS